MRHRTIAGLALLFAAVAAITAMSASPAWAGRDPFARPALHAAAPADPADPASAPMEPAARPQLRAIMFAPDHALVNISGRILEVGDWFGDYKVVRIRERSVTLAARGGAKSELALDVAANK
jgi:hypothetical protein